MQQEPPAEWCHTHLKFLFTLGTAAASCSVVCSVSAWLLLLLAAAALLLCCVCGKDYCTRNFSRVPRMLAGITRACVTIFHWKTRILLCHTVHIPVVCYSMNCIIGVFNLFTVVFARFGRTLQAIDEGNKQASNNPCIISSAPPPARGDMVPYKLLI